VWIVVYAWSNFLEREAERHQQFSSTLFNTSADGMMITEQHCQIEAVNPAFEKLTGYSAREILGKKPDILASGQHSSDFLSPCETVCSATVVGKAMSGTGIKMASYMCSTSP
jgi:PAS domain-containing protein